MGKPVDRLCHSVNFRFFFFCRISEHDRLEAIRQDLRSDVERLRSEPAIRKQALDAGLGQLGAPLLIPAR